MPERRAIITTAAICQAQGITYKPLVFSAQGGVSREAEDLITQLAKRVEQHEGKPAGLVKREFLEDVSLFLLRQAVRAHARRSGVAQRPSALTQLAVDLARASARVAERNDSDDDCSE